MVAHVAFRKLDTGESKTVKVGWSWTLFFFGPIFGIPFWIRKFYTYAALMIGWDALCILIPDSSHLNTLVRGASIGLSITLGREGNKLTAQYYLNNGWQFVDPDADATIYARQKWALA